ncbi:hypothetical protein SAMN05421791_10111 [Facklamia miroungae]|uniref:Uncharacterized protein n=1 Tax=Facklamia miroungae TaxID=120956 RepID=A0A1G7NX86_9LACT|nr:hypothetical protein SAMN05421791_10111 [Facklamia miroungae]
MSQILRMGQNLKLNSIMSPNYHIARLLLIY